MELVNDAPKAANFENLIFFRIYVTSPQESSRQISVFRNTRQQCRIKVAFIAVDSNNRQIVLTPTEIEAAVRLIRYVGGTDILHGNSFGSHPEWYSSFTSQGWTWDLQDMAAAQALQDDIDKVIADNLDIDNLEAFSAADKSSRIRSLTSTSPEHHWGKEFFENMIVECRRERSSPAKLSPLESIQEPDVVPNDHPLLGSPSDDEWEGRQDGAQVVTFLVSTFSNVPLAIAATMSSSTGRKFKTNHGEVEDPNGHGNGRGEFNSQVVVNPLPQPTYPIAAFGNFLPMGSGTDYVLQHHLVYGGGTGLRAYEHYISLTVDGKWIRLWGIVSPALGRDATLWNDLGDVGAEWCYSYFGNPGQFVRHHADNVIGYFRSGNNSNLKWDSRELMHIVTPSGIHRPLTGQFTIGQVMSNEHLQINDWNNAHSARRSQSIVIRDIHGNDHRLRLYLPDGYYKFNFIAIAKN